MGVTRWNTETRQHKTFPFCCHNRQNQQQPSIQSSAASVYWLCFGRFHGLIVKNSHRRKENTENNQRFIPASKAAEIKKALWLWICVQSMTSPQVNVEYVGSWKTNQVKATVAQEQVMLSGLSWQGDVHGLKRSAGIWGMWGEPELIRRGALQPRWAPSGRVENMRVGIMCLARGSGEDGVKSLTWIWSLFQKQIELNVSVDQRHRKARKFSWF